MTQKFKNVKVGTATLIFKNKKVLLIKRQGSHGVGTWAPPGGHIDFGEKDLEKSAKREVKEEVGIAIKDLKFVGITNDIFKKENKHYTTIWFTAHWKSGKEKIENKEMSEIGWFSLKNPPKPLFLCLKNFIKGKKWPK